MFVSKARTHNEKMMKIYAQNYTLPTTQPTRRFNNPFLIQSSQVLLSQILKKQSSTSTPTVKTATDLNPVNDETSNIETQADSTKATEAKKDVIKTKTKADAKAKAKTDAKADAKAEEIQDKFNKTVAAQKAEADAEKAKIPDADAQTANEKIQAGKRKREKEAQAKSQKEAIDSISKKIKESTDPAEKANLNSQKILIQDSSALKEAEANLKKTTDPKQKTALKAIIEQKKKSVNSLKKSIKKYNTDNAKTERLEKPGYLNAEIVGQLNRDDLLTSSGIDSRDGFYIYPGLTSKESKKYNDNLAIRQEKFKSFKAFKLKASEESVKPKTSKVRKQEDKGASKTIEKLRKEFNKADAVLDKLINKAKANKSKANNPMGKKQGTTRPLTDEASSLEKGRHNSGLRGGN